jgi:hypothetical protein
MKLRKTNPPLAEKAQFFGVRFPVPLRVAEHREHQVWLVVA